MKSPKSRFHLIGIFKPVISVLFLIFFITYNSHIYSQQIAFPTAKGAGAYATGGRGGQVIHVTNLNGSGEGSLLEAIRTTGARIIVFDVSGVITLDVGEWQNLISGSSYNDLTIAGQTAPEGGITIKCRDILVNEVDNIVIRYVRFRHYNQNYTRDAVNFQGCQNVIFDHVTASNGADECISFTTSASNRIPDKTTMQRCYLQDSKTGSIFGDNTSGGTNSTEFTIVNNLFQNISHRFSNPIGDGSRHDILNNVVYNWKRRLIRTTHSVDVNAINNYYKSAGGGTSTWYSNPVVDKICQQAQLQSGDTTKIYSAGNVVDVPSGDTGWSASTDDRAMWRVFTSSGIATPVGDLVPDSYFRVPYVAFDLVGEAYTIKTAVEAYADVLADVGANKYLNSDGSVSFWQDAKDTSAILEVTNDTYSEAWYDGSDWGYNTDEHIGTIPNNTRAGNYDTDGDGMADVWETTTFGDLTKTSAGDEDSDGYTNIEEFLNQVDGDQPNIPKITRIDSNPTTIEVGGTYAPPTGTWTDVEDISGTATVGGDIVDVNKIGTYNVTLEHTDTDGNRGYLPIPVYIVAPPVNAIGVTVTPETVSIEDGFTTQLSATVNGSGEDATDQTGDWTSDATNIATVEITSGLVIGVLAGSATITFTSNDGGFTDTSVITVTAPLPPLAPALDSAVLSGNDYILTFHQPAGSGLPEGGYDTFINSLDQNDNAFHSVFTRTITGLDTSVEQRFKLEARYTQYDPSQFPQSNEIIVAPVANTVEANAGEDKSICENESVTLTASGGSNYLWNTGETTQSIIVSPLVTTTYSVTVSNDFNSDTDEVTVTVNALPTASAGTDEEICENDSITLSASGGDAYEWNTGQTTQSITVSPEDTTTYTVTVTNNGCSATDEVTVTVRPRPSVNAGNDVDIYQNESITLTASGDGTFVWDTGEETESITVSPAQTTTYTVTANLNGCSSSDSVTVTVIEPEQVTANAGEDKSICENESVTLTASGGPNYLWSNNETTQSITVSPTVTTTYSVTVSNDFHSDTDEVIVTVNPIPIASAGSDRTILHGEAITLSSSGGPECIWSTGETTPNITVEPTETTTYTVEVFENGCSDIASVTVIVGVSASVGGEATICQGESTTLYAAGGSYYEWSTGENTQSIEVSPTETTTYSVVVSNNTSSDVAEITVNVNLVPDADAGEDVTIESGQNVTLTASGGNSYLWSNNETTQSISVSPSDTTTYTVESIINGCSNSDDVKVSVVQQVNANAGEDMQICLGESTVLTASGGLYFTWDTGVETASISVSPDATTVYSVTVSNGFSSQTAEVVVTVEDCQDIDTIPQNFGFEYRVFPNPTDGQVNIRLSGIENVSSIYISDLTGKVISTETFEPNNGYVIDKQYDFSSFSKGIYLITFKQIGEVAISKKLIVK